jgi:hypothetical protein
MAINKPRITDADIATTLDNAEGKRRETELKATGDAYQGRDVTAQDEAITAGARSLGAMGAQVMDSPFISALRNNISRGLNSRNLTRGPGSGTLAGMERTAAGNLSSLPQADAVLQEGQQRQATALDASRGAGSGLMAAIELNLAQKGLNDEGVRFYHQQGFEIREAIRQAAIDKQQQLSKQYLSRLGSQGQAESNAMDRSTRFQQGMTNLGIQAVAAGGAALAGAGSPSSEDMAEADTLLKSGEITREQYNSFLKGKL